MRRLENHIDRFFPRIDPSVLGSKPMPADLTQCWRPFLSISFPSNTTVARPWSCRLPRSPLNRWGNIWRGNGRTPFGVDDELVASFAKWIKSCNDKGLSGGLYLYPRTKPKAE